jgi:hypothetical protein
MRLALALLVTISCVSPGVASAASVGGRLRSNPDEGDIVHGKMHYRARHGIANRLTITRVVAYDRFRVTEQAERLRAYGDCEQVDRHTAICPWTESEAPIEVRVGGRADRVTVKGVDGARVFGGSGNDVLVGNRDELFGERGSDLLRGGPAGGDALHGGPGRDRMEGRGRNLHRPGVSYDDDPPDEFYDDETDAQAARDVIIAGRNGGAGLDYSMRRRPLRIDLRRRVSGPERDIISGVSGVTGGAGSDVLIGNGRPGLLSGGAGDDRLYGLGGDDLLTGDQGNDVLRGGKGDDHLWESYDVDSGGGSDRFVGGPGADTADALDQEPDEVRCDSRDGPVVSDPADRLRACSVLEGWDQVLWLDVQPQITDDRATFTLSCGTTESAEPGSGFLGRCHGRLSLKSLAGDDLGSTIFQFGSNEDGTLFNVTVPLTAAGQKSLRDGAVIEVEAQAISADGWHFPIAGYRTFIRASGP